MVYGFAIVRPLFVAPLHISQESIILHFRLFCVCPFLRRIYPFLISPIVNRQRIVAFRKAVTVYEWMCDKDNSTHSAHRKNIASKYMDYSEEFIIEIFYFYLYGFHRVSPFDTPITHNAKGECVTERTRERGWVGEKERERDCTKMENQ